MFEKRKYFDYKLAYKMYEKCKKLLDIYDIDELDNYFEEVGDRENGYTTYYGASYNTWVYIINNNFDTDKEEETWLNGKEGLVVSGEVDMISYGEGEDTLFINNIEDIEKSINGLLDYAKANNYTIQDYEKELASLEWVLGILNTRKVYKKALEDYTELQKIFSTYIIENKLETNKFEKLCELIRTDNRFSITNDLMEENMIDFWFKDILLTIKKVGNVGYELFGIEVYDTDGEFYRDFNNIESLVKEVEE